MSNAAVGHAHVKALVYVAALALEAGESIGVLSGMFPGGALGETLHYHQQFIADMPADRAALDAVTRRPLNTTALNEGSGEPAWKTVPSRFVYPELDRNIPLEAHRFMAERAGARTAVELPGPSPTRSPRRSPARSSRSSCKRPPRRWVSGRR
jgi:hypothetical protein